MRMSDWSSDVCSSDLIPANMPQPPFHVSLFLAYRGKIMQHFPRGLQALEPGQHPGRQILGGETATGGEIGRAPCRERVCQSVYISVVAVAFNNKQKLYAIETESSHTRAHTPLS